MLALPGIGHHPLHRDNNFDDLRVLAAAMVMLTHSWALVKRADEPIAEITFGSLAGGPLGVWMFFAISGYLVCQSYIVRRNLLAFVEARVLRIYPAFAARIVFGVAVGAVATTLPLSEFIRHSQTWDYFRNNLLFELRYSLPGVFATNPYPNAVNGSIWTLPAETMLYVLVALLGVTTVLARRVWAGLMLVALLLVGHAVFCLSGADPVARRLGRTAAIAYRADRPAPAAGHPADVRSDYLHAILAGVSSALENTDL